jgi:hypothetical protein
LAGYLRRKALTFDEVVKIQGEAEALPKHTAPFAAAQRPPQWQERAGDARW